MRAISRFAMPLLGATLIGCVDSPSRTGELDADAIPRINLVEELRIGSVEDPNYGFSSIGGADVDDIGNIYVFEAADRQIRVYSERGEFLQSIGRRGQGPGEFGTSLLRFGFTQDTLWTWFWTGLPGDGGRITLFATDGRVLATSSLQQIMWYDWDGNCSAIIPEMTIANGYILGGRYPGITYAPFCPARPDADRTEEATLKWPHVRFATDGSVVDTAGSYEIGYRAGPLDTVRVGQHEYTVAPPPSDQPAHTTFPGGVYRIERPVATNASHGQFVVVRQTFRGDTVFSRTYEYTPRTYSSAVLDIIAARWLPRNRSSQDSIAALAAIRRAMSFPPFQPPIQETYVGRDGTLWLRREDLGEPTFRWIVLDTAGVPRGEVELPRSDTQIVWSRGNQVLFTETDALGVPWLVRYRLE